MVLLRGLSHAGRAAGQLGRSRVGVRFLDRAKPEDRNRVFALYVDEWCTDRTGHGQNQIDLKADSPSMQWCDFYIGGASAGGFDDHGQYAPEHDGAFSQPHTREATQHRYVSGTDVRLETAVPYTHLHALIGLPVLQCAKFGSPNGHGWQMLTWEDFAAHPSVEGLYPREGAVKLSGDTASNSDDGREKVVTTSSKK